MPAHRLTQEGCSYCCITDRSSEALFNARLQATLRYAEESTSAAEQIAALQQQLSAEQDAKESERREREQAEQQVAELKVGATASIHRELVKHMNQIVCPSENNTKRRVLAASTASNAQHSQ